MSASPTRAELRSMISGWRAEIAELERRIAVCTEALRLYDETSGPRADTNPGIAIISDCRTQREALVALALHNGGVVRARDAAQIIYDAGMARGKLTSAIATVHNLLNNSDEWERIAPGTFRLTQMDEAGREDPPGDWSAAPREDQPTA